MSIVRRNAVKWFSSLPEHDKVNITNTKFNGISPNLEQLCDLYKEFRVNILKQHFDEYDVLEVSQILCKEAGTIPVDRYLIIGNHPESDSIWIVFYSHDLKEIRDAYNNEKITPIIDHGMGDYYILDLFKGEKVSLFNLDELIQGLE